MTINERELEHYRSMVEMVLRTREDRPTDVLYVETRLQAIVQGYSDLLAKLDQWFMQNQNPYQFPPGYGADIRPDIKKEIRSYKALLTQLWQGLGRKAEV